MSRYVRCLLITLALGLWATAVEAAKVGPAIADSPFVAVVEVLSVGDGMVELRTIAPISPSVPSQFRAHLEGATPHALQKGQRVLAALGQRTTGAWAYRSITRSPMAIRKGSERVVARFATRWRAHRDDSPATRFDRLIGLTTHPSALARKAAFDALLEHAQTLRPISAPTRLRTLAAPLFEPLTPETEASRRVAAIGRLGGRDAAEALALRFDALGSAPARRQVAALLARQPSRRNLRVLKRCAKTASFALAARCTRLLSRLASKGVRASSLTPKPSTP